MFSFILSIIVTVCQAMTAVVLVLAVACLLSKQIHKSVWGFAGEHQVLTTAIIIMAMYGIASAVLTSFRY